VRMPVFKALKEGVKAKSPTWGNPYYGGASRIEVGGWGTRIRT
jgi:hypothetical protein